jgi:branched-subunit amino acid permease
MALVLHLVLAILVVLYPIVTHVECLNIMKDVIRNRRKVRKQVWCVKELQNFGHRRESND